MPEGHSFRDKAGHVRHHVRLRWWNGNGRTWRDVAMSVPDPDALPDAPLPASLAGEIYPPDERPVFFGHYWLTGSPELQSRNALCLDYSAGADGPLVTYALAPGADEVSLDGLRINGVKAGDQG